MTSTEEHCFEPFVASVSTDINSKIVVLKPIENDVLNMLTFGMRYTVHPNSIANSFPPKSVCKLCLGETFYSDSDGFFCCCSRCHSSNAGKSLASRYQILNQLGKGCFSTTFKAVDKFSNQQERFVTLKIINKNYMYEIQVLQFLQQKDPNQHFAFVRLLDKFLWKDSFLCLVEEYLEIGCTDSELFPFCGLENLTCNPNCYTFEHYLVQRTQRNMRIRQWKKVTFQSLKFLAFLSANQIIHADLKADNCMFARHDSLTVRFIDFGNALHSDNACHYWDQFEIQPLAYRAPEVLFGCPFDCSIDMWSIGCLLSGLWLGKALFEQAQNELELCQMIFAMFPQPAPEPFLQGKFYWKYFGACQTDERESSFRTLMAATGMPLEGIDLLMQMLQLDPGTRIKPKDALLHSFMAEFVEPLLYCIM